MAMKIVLKNTQRNSPVSPIASRRSFASKELLVNTENIDLKWRTYFFKRAKTS
jgi:hypothetical protein